MQIPLILAVSTLIVLSVSNKVYEFIVIVVITIASVEQQAPNANDLHSGY